MTEIQPFTFPATGQDVRAVVIDGDPWFILADAAKILGYRDAEHAARLLRDHQLSTLPEGTWRDLGGRGSRPKIVTEGGLYRLVMRSNVALAEPFQDWVTDDVLPAIRRTGRYEVPALGNDLLAELEASNNRTAQAIEIAKAERARAETAEAERDQLKPDAHAWQILGSGDGDFSVADAAKILSRDPAISIGRDRLFEALAEMRWLYRQQADGRWRAYQSQVNLGRLSELPQQYENKRTGQLALAAPQVRISVKGLTDLHRRLGGTEPLAIEDGE